MKTIFILAMKNLTRQKRRSFMLAIAICFGFLIVTTIDGLATGAINNLIIQITQLNGGNVLVQGQRHLKDENGKILKKCVDVIDEPEFVENLFLESDIEYSTYSRRSLASGTILFNKKKLSASVWGCLFEKEDFLLDSFVVDAGSIEKINEPYSIVMTRKNADILNIQVGDSVLFTTTTINGQSNVAEFTLKAIIKDNSILDSVTMYAPMSSINEVLEMNPEEYTVFSIFTDDKKQKAVAQKIEDMIREKGRKVTSRQDAIKASPTNMIGKLRKQITDDVSDEQVIYITAALYDAVPMLEQIVSIVHTVTTVILVVILLIVMVGISNTYRMVLYERIKEIGTMRSVGMTGKTTGKLFTTEAVVLSLFGAIAGCIIAFIILFAVSKIPVNYEPLSFFLKNGYITYQLSVGSVLMKYVIMILFTVFAVRGTAKKAAALSPAQALR